MTKLLCSLCLIFAFFASGSSKASEDPLTIFAAASLTDVLPKLGDAWSKQSGHPAPRYSFAASAVMARQIVAGAPADLLISANPTWIEFVQNHKGAKYKVHNLADNQLVLAVPTNRKVQLSETVSAHSLLELISSNRVAIADPSVSPAGQYARKYFESLGIWQKLSPQLAFGTNVRQTLLMIERGGLTGFVYHSDAKQSERAHIAYIIPSDLTGRITYQGIKTSSTNQTAEAFLIFLQASSADAIWRNSGFLKTVSN